MISTFWTMIHHKYSPLLIYNINHHYGYLVHTIVKLLLVEVHELYETIQHHSPSVDHIDCYFSLNTPRTMLSQQQHFTIVYHSNIVINIYFYCFIMIYPCLPPATLSINYHGPPWFAMTEAPRLQQPENLRAAAEIPKQMPKKGQAWDAADGTHRCWLHPQFVMVKCGWWIMMVNGASVFDV